MSQSVGIAAGLGASPAPGLLATAGLSASVERGRELEQEPAGERTPHPRHWQALLAAAETG